MYAWEIIYSGLCVCISIYICTYDEFDDVDGWEVGFEGGDAELEATGEELLGVLLTVGGEIRVDACATVNGYSPSTHDSFLPLSLSVSSLSILSSLACLIWLYVYCGVIIIPDSPSWGYL